MLANSNELISRVILHSGASAEQAARALHTIVVGLSHRLDPVRRELVADELPPELGAMVTGGGELAVPLEEELLAVAPRLGSARELIASVCHALAEELSTEAVAALRTVAPASIAGFFVAEEPVAPPPAPDPEGHTLATGRPGSQHPLSERRR